MQAQKYQFSPVSHLSSYDMKDTIGCGSFGEVKLAIHKKTNQKVAMKFVSKNEDFDNLEQGVRNYVIEEVES